MNTNRGGTYVAAGVGTAVTGRGANIALIDDPFKDREEADSERRRDTVWDWYRSTLYTRLMPGGAIVLIQTRWHEDDLAGRLLEHEGSQWDVLELPALHPDRGALWPEWYDETALLRIKETIGPREWSALYQQQPQPDDGTFFQRQWFKSYDKLPNCRFYITSDFAVTDGGGDYTVLTVWGISSNGDIYRADQWKGQTASDVWIERMLDLIARWKPLCCFGESGVIQKAVGPILARRSRERGVFSRFEWLPSVSDKPTRARSFQAFAASGRVHFERGADLSEFLVFPAGKHDDEVDTASLIGRAIDQAHPAIVRDTPAKKPRDRWDREIEEAGNWKTL
jgi:predicted phage terminase large subunit-like protein